jgi:hypothetical protein
MKRESNPAMAQVGRVEEKNDWRNCTVIYSNQDLGIIVLKCNFPCRKNTFCNLESGAPQLPSMQDDRDAAEFDEASYEVDYAAFCDGTPTAEPITNHRRAAEAMMHTLNHFLTFFAEHGYWRSRTLWGVAFALGHPMTAGRSMLEVARDLGCTKQAISKVATNYLNETGLPPSAALKTDQAKKTYKKTNGNRNPQPTN